MSRNHQIDWTTSDNFTGRNNANATRSNTSLNAQSTSSLDLINNNVSYNTQERDATLKALLPVYRLAPDYETAIRKMNQKQRTNDTHLHTSHKVASDPHLNVYSVSQPDVHRATDATLGHHHRQQHPDVTSYYRNFTPNVNRMDALPHHQLMRMHKRPPAYPTEWLISSTPDLAGASHRALFRPAFVTGSSPDLISQQATIQAVPSNAVRRHHSQTQMPHGAAEQLNANLLLPNAYRVSPQQQYGYIGSSRQLSGSIEPIHENQIYQSQTDVTGTSYQSHQQRLSNPNVVQILQHSSRSLESISQHQTSASSVDPNELSGVSRRHVQFDALNRSQSADLLDSGVVTSSSEDRAKEKKKRRWKFWGNKGKSSLNEKAKSGTLERDKGKSGKKALSTEEEIDSRHRWSTGLPRVPVPTTISKEKLGQILGTKLADPQLYVEYERIPKRKANESYDCALNDENRTKNFDPSFLPYDGNRVRLTPSPGNRLGYYNASVISATVGTKQRFYIIAQSPHAVNELSTFLQCVWEADVYLLVQLSDEVNYVPETSNNCAEYGQYQIWKEFSEKNDRCVTSKLRIYHTASRRYRSVWHLNYCRWAEQNCPSDVNQYLEFLEELSSVRLASINEVPRGHNTNPPVMIHCSEGGGRSGVTLLSDLLLYTVDNNQDLDIPRVLSHLREQRDNIVPSLAQYKFVYALLIRYLKCSRLI